MYNAQLIQSFLERKRITASYHIWMSSPEYATLIPIESSRNTSKDLPTEVPYSSEMMAIVTQNDITQIVFNYPDQYQIYIVIEQLVEDSSINYEGLYFLLYPCYSSYAINASKYKLDIMIESIGNTTTTLDLEEIFSKILSATLTVIPNADLGTLWIFDSELDRLVCKASVGNVMRGITDMQFKIGEGIIGHSFKTGKSTLFVQPDELEYKEITALTMDNLQHWDKKYEFEKSVPSMLSIPISVDGQVECVMNLCQIKSKHALTEYDAHILQGFSSQLGIAIKNARLYADLKSQNELLKKRGHIHSKLTELSMQNLGVSKVIRELQRMIGQPLFFIDLLENECIPTKYSLPEQFSYEMIRSVLSSDKEKSYYKTINSDSKTYFIYPITSGKLELGCLLIEASKPLSKLDYVTLEQGNAVLALELIKTQNVVEFYYKKKRELFNIFLDTNNPAYQIQKARELGFVESGTYVAAIFQFSQYNEPQVLETHMRILITCIKKELSSSIQMMYGHHNRVTLLINASSKLNVTECKRKLEYLVVEWGKYSNNIVLSGGMGSVYNGIHLIEKTYQEAKIALSYFQVRQKSGWMEYEKIGINRLFINQKTEEINQFQQNIFNPLRPPLNANNTLEQTLMTYFECNQSAAQTAKKLFIHINTLYQRLRKIEDVLQVSFENPENVLRLQLACYLRETFGGE